MASAAANKYFKSTLRSGIPAPVRVSTPVSSNLQRQLNSLTAEKKSIESEYKKLQRESADLKRKLANKQTTEKERNALRTKLEEYNMYGEKALKELEKLEGNVQLKQKQISALEKNLAQARASANQRQRNLEAALKSKNFNAATIAQHEATIARKNLFLQAHQAALARAQKHEAARTKQQLNAHRTALEKQKEAANKRVEEFRTIARQAETNAQRGVAEAFARVAEAEAKAREAEVKASQLNSTTADRNAAQKRVAELEKAIQYAEKEKNRQIRNAKNAETAARIRSLEALANAHQQAELVRGKNANLNKARQNLAARTIQSAFLRKKKQEANAARAAANAARAKANRRAGNAQAAANTVRATVQAQLAEIERRRAEIRAALGKRNEETKAKEALQEEIRKQRQAAEKALQNAKTNSARKIAEAEQKALEAAEKLAAAEAGSAAERAARERLSAAYKNVLASVNFERASKNKALQEAANAARRASAAAAAANAARANANRNKTSAAAQVSAAQAERNAHAKKIQSLQAQLSITEAGSAEQKRLQNELTAEKEKLSEALRLSTNKIANLENKLRKASAGSAESNNLRSLRVSTNLFKLLQGSVSRKNISLKNRMAVTATGGAGGSVTGGSVGPITITTGGGGGGITGDNIAKIITALKQQSPNKKNTNNAEKLLTELLGSSNAQRIKVIKTLLKYKHGINMNNNKVIVEPIPPPIPSGPARKNNKFNDNLNNALSPSDRFSRLRRLQLLVAKHPSRKSEIINYMRETIRKLYGSNVKSSTNALRNIQNARRILYRKVNKGINENLNIALKRLQQKKPTSRGDSGVYRVSNRGFGNIESGYRGGGGGGYSGGGGGAPSITVAPQIKINTGGGIPLTQPEQRAFVNAGGVANAKRLITSAGGIAKVENALEHLNTAPENVRAVVQKLGGSVKTRNVISGVKKLTRTKKRVSRKPKYIKLTPKQLHEITKRLKKNNLRKILVKEITRKKK